MRRWNLLLPVIALSLCTIQNANAGTIVVNNDEWTLTNTGFTNTSGDAANFALNIAELFAGGGTGSFLVYSQDFSFITSGTDPMGTAAQGSNLASTVTGAGHSWTVDASTTFDLATLLAYDGIFLAGDVGGVAPDNQVLIDYIEAGGNVYLAGGTANFAPSTGCDLACAEAAAWNTLLAHFGLAFDDSYTGAAGWVDTSGVSHPLFDGVSSLWNSGGNAILDLNTPGTNGHVFNTSLPGRYAIASTQSIQETPEPGTLILFGTGLAGFASWRKRKRG